MAVGKSGSAKANATGGALAFVNSLIGDPEKLAEELEKLTNARGIHEKAAAVNRSTAKQALKAREEAEAAEASAATATRKQESAYAEQNKILLIRTAKAESAEAAVGRASAAAKEESANAIREINERKKELHDREAACNATESAQAKQGRDLDARQKTIDAYEGKIAALRAAMRSFNG